MTKAETTNQRVAELRELMRREHLAAFIFPSTDPHASEYVPSHWETRKWISGFDGSAGTAVVTLHEAALWTDSRYFLAAEEQLRGTDFSLMRERIEGTPTIAEWLADVLSDSDSTEVGIYGLSASATEVEDLIAGLRQRGGLTVRTNFDPAHFLWKDRPSLPNDPIRIHPLHLAGESCSDKLKRLRRRLRELHADGMLVSALDDIAWTLNLRGSDVHCNPVFMAYLLIEEQGATLYADPKKLTDEVRRYLAANGVQTAHYAAVCQGLQDYFAYTILMDPSETNYALLHLQGTRYQMVRQPSPIPAMKAVKNAAEQEGFRRSMLRDGVAMVRFLMWLEGAVAKGGETEMTADEKLTALRAANPEFRGLSFDTIAGYAAHGAIVHYEATPETDAALRPEGLLLLDSGAQYEDGTTDITRTIALGPVSDEMKRVYTLVLKGHLQLQNLHFPEGAAGTQLDAVARMAMWRDGMNFMHGTGHGVGSYLNVHEGPHQIRMEWRPAPLRAGMTVTDEPGLYLAGRFGVRTENTLLVVPDRETAFGRFLKFEPLTLCPIDKRPIVADMLTPEERQWLNDYHQYVFDKLSPLLSPAEQQWLAEACAAL